MPTFLHTADIHLDSAFSANFDAKGAELRRGELLHSTFDMIERAKGLDLLLIAGDLFDGGSVSAQTLAGLKRKFAEIPDTHIFIAAGNHDAYTPQSVYARYDFGDNVHVFGTEAECIELPEINTRVFGVSFASPLLDEPIAIPKIEKTDGITDILVMHADIVSLGGESAYNPIDKSFLENCGADYVALGHIHKRSEVKRCGQTYYAYPGSPEGRGFDECGDMGCYIGEIKEGVLDVKFEKTSKRRMFHAEADLSGATDSINAFEIAMREIEKIGTPNDFYKLTLTGATNNLDVDFMKKELGDRLHFVEVIDKTRPEYDIEKLAAQNTLCGEFVRIMKRRIEAAEDKELLLEAMHTGIAALLGGES